jgi:hypothetical protein
MTSITGKSIAIGTIAVLAAGASAPAVAQAEQGKPEHCISINRIDHTEVVSDREILFFMHGDRIFLNKLPHRCPGLEFEEAFMYRASVGQLCDLDIITVLDGMGFGYMPGVSCGLGMFTPVSKATAQSLQQSD